MSNDKKTMSLGDALPAEIERVNEIIEIYNNVPNGHGRLAAGLMRADVDDATKALAAGDVVAMLSSFEKLKSWEL